MSYITTYSGRKFDFKNISKENVYIPDILHSLPRINRFVGHSERPYNVGEHTFLGLVMAEKLGYTPMQKLNWFIHDFTEAYMNDVPKPLKELLPEFIEIEAQVEKVIREHLGLEDMSEEEHRLVKRIDVTMLVIEMKYLTKTNHEIFITDDTYLEMIEDDDFILGLIPVNEKTLEEILTTIFKSLMEEIKNEI